VAKRIQPIHIAIANTHYYSGMTGPNTIESNKCYLRIVGCCTTDYHTINYHSLGYSGNLNIVDLDIDQFGRIVLGILIDGFVALLELKGLLVFPTPSSLSPLLIFSR